MENKDIIILILFVIILYLIYCDNNKNKRIKRIEEKFDDPVGSEINEEHKFMNKMMETIEGRVDNYLGQRAEVPLSESIKNLGVFAKKLQDNDGNLVIPANVQIRGKLSVIDDETDEVVLQTSENAINLRNLNSFGEKLNINGDLEFNNDITIKNGKSIKLLDVTNNDNTRMDIKNSNDGSSYITLHGGDKESRILKIKHSISGSWNKNTYEFGSDNLKCRGISSIDGKTHPLEEKAFFIRPAKGQLVTIGKHGSNSIVNTARDIPRLDIKRECDKADVNKCTTEWVSDNHKNTNSDAPLLTWGDNLSRDDKTGLYYHGGNFRYSERWFHYY